jgi:3-phosphoshikimate 1-carboxyvinyltransferase
LATLAAFKKLGVKFTLKKNKLTINGKGLYGLRKPKGPIHLVNSGTSFRLLLGLLVGQKFASILTAGGSLSQRPMHRVILPLRKMGAVLRPRIIGTIAYIEEYPPVEIEGAVLKGITYKLPIASAQVKSAILLAGLYAKGKTMIVEEIQTRDHTERMLKSFKAKIAARGKSVSIAGGSELKSPKNIYLPGDISSAAFFMVAAAILPNSAVTIRNVNLNPTRIGVFNVLKRMGVKVKITGRSPASSHTEPKGDISVVSSRLKGVRVGKTEIPSLIDELPVLMVAASFARGKSVFEGISELRVKETDRIKSMCHNLTAMGVDARVESLGENECVMVKGAKVISGATVKSFGDHRTAMSMVIAGLAASGSSTLDDISCISKSFPGFLAVLNRLIRSN